MNQFNIADLGAELCSDPHTAFICPPLYREKVTRRAEIGEHGNSDLENPIEATTGQLDVNDLLQSESNFIIEGHRESGKTSLAHFLAVAVAEGTVDRPRLPVIIDYRNLRLNKYGLVTALSSYLKIPKAGYDVEGGMKRGELIFILDNFDLEDQGRLKALIYSAKAYPSCRWIALADTKIGGSKTDPELKEVVSFGKVYLRTLPRHSIRALTARWCNRTGADREETYSTVMSQIRDGDLPRTGYIVTLLLWALKQNKRMERINESALLMNVIDYLLGKADFTKAIDSEFDATAKEIVLQELAWYLKERNGSVDINDATQFFISFFKSKGLNYEASSIIHSFCACGILHKFDSSISFKYRCFQDYFCAKKIASSEKVLKRVLYKRSYLGFLREIDLASGLMRINEEVVDELVYQAIECRPGDVRDYQDEDFDNIVESASAVGVTRRQLSKIRKTRLTARQIDDLMDNAEAALVKKDDKVPNQKTESDESASDDSPDQSEGDSLGLETSRYDQPLSPPDYMLSIDLLGRVLRNSEFLDKEKKVSGVTTFIRSNSHVFFKLNDVIATLIDGFISDMRSIEDEIDQDTEIALKHFLATTIMMMIADRNKDAIQSYKLIPVFKEILARKDLTRADKMFLTALQLDVGNPDWDSAWKSLAKSSTKKRLVTQFLSDRLWTHIHDRVQNEQSQQKIISVATELEIELSDSPAAPKMQRGFIGSSVKKAYSDVLKKSDED